MAVSWLLLAAHIKMTRETLANAMDAGEEFWTWLDSEIEKDAVGGTENGE
jgi:hypothetical protein